MLRLAAWMIAVATLTLDPAAGRAEACGPRLIATFVEDSPDHFVLHNAGDPGWAVSRVELDLGPTRGKLIFDVTETGAGVSAHQPYGEVGGSAVLVTRTEVTDGDSLLSLAFARFAPGERYMFAIDLDDTLPTETQTWISDDEIDGAVLRAWFARGDGSRAERTAIFEADSRADTGRHEGCLVS